jgi:O-antigen biosynthesis protein
MIKTIFRKIELSSRRLPDSPFINRIFCWIISLIYALSDKRRLLKGRKDNSDDLYSNRSPLISVYVPTYNRCKILRDRAIPTVLAQTYKNFELIVADDGSTDDTKGVVKSFNDPRIKYIKVSRNEYRYPNRSLYHWFSGPIVAANLALDKCQGAWIARIDDDDLWTENHLEDLLKLAIEGNYEFVSSHLLYVSNDGKETVATKDNEVGNITGICATQTWLYRNYLSKFKYNINSWRKLHDRPNDIDLRGRFYNSGVKIGYLEEITAIIKPRPDERHIGSKAYLADEEKYENFYKM